jgi:hypothetical protein
MNPEMESANTGGPPPDVEPVNQPWNAFLVLDVEGTCEDNTPFSYPNEIIVEYPDVNLCNAVFSFIYKRSGLSVYFAGPTRQKKEKQVNSKLWTNFVALFGLHGVLLYPRFAPT